MIYYHSVLNNVPLTNTLNNTLGFTLGWEPEENKSHLETGGRNNV